jgi:hypothetical protein
MTPAPNNGRVDPSPEAGYVPDLSAARSEGPIETLEHPRARAPFPRRRVARLLLPAPVSAGRGLSVLIFGFALEGATEVYQFLMRGNLVQGPVAYYTTLGTTILGFYLMFLGLREWRAFHPAPAPRRPVPSGRRWPWFGLALWTGGTAATALLSLVLGTGGTAASPFWIAWPVGGVVVLAFGRFFSGLRKEAHERGSPAGNSLGWGAFLWSLGVATVAGLVVGDLALVLLIEFVTSWGALIVSVGPIVVAMSPLFVAYALMTGAYVTALRRERDGLPWTPVRGGVPEPPLPHVRKGPGSDPEAALAP